MNQGNNLSDPQGLIKVAEKFQSHKPQHEYIITDCMKDIYSVIKDIKSIKKREQLLYYMNMSQLCLPINNRIQQVNKNNYRANAILKITFLCISKVLMQNCYNVITDLSKQIQMPVENKNKLNEFIKRQIKKRLEQITPFKNNSNNQQESQDNFLKDVLTESLRQSIRNITESDLTKQQRILCIKRGIKSLEQIMKILDKKADQDIQQCINLFDTFKYSQLKLKFRYIVKALDQKYLENYSSIDIKKTKLQQLVDCQGCQKICSYFNQVIEPQVSEDILYCSKLWQKI